MLSFVVSSDNHTLCMTGSNGFWHSLQTCKNSTLYLVVTVSFHILSNSLFTNHAAI
jgi:hypothetical protein